MTDYDNNSSSYTTNARINDEGFVETSTSQNQTIYTPLGGQNPIHAEAMRMKEKALGILDQYNEQRFDERTGEGSYVHSPHKREMLRMQYNQLVASGNYQMQRAAAWETENQRKQEAKLDRMRHEKAMQDAAKTMADGQRVQRMASLMIPNKR